MKLKDTCSLEEKLDQPRQHIKKPRQYLVNKCSYSQSYDFSSSHVQMWELNNKKGWALKNCCFWTVALRVPWTARRSNQSILKEINLEYSLERLMLRLKLQYFGHLMWRADSWKRPWCWERLKARGEGYDRGWDGWMASLTQSTWFWASSGWWWKIGKTGVL